MFSGRLAIVAKAVFVPIAMDSSFAELYRSEAAWLRVVTVLCFSRRQRS